MKDRVRETLFDVIGADVAGAIAIDLFAGTGALGFEAVSRGAMRAVFCERHFPTADVLWRSARALGIEDRVEVTGGDVLLWARRMPPLDTQSRWIVFASPPWSCFEERPAELVALVDALITRAPPGSIVVVESDVSFDPSRLPAAEAWTHRAIPPAVLHMLKR